MKKQEKTERTKARILNAAMQEFGEKGYLRTTVNAICTHYHIPKGLLYHNFAGKDELYLICVERCFSELISYLQPHAIAEIETYLELRYSLRKDWQSRSKRAGKRLTASIGRRFM